MRKHSNRLFTVYELLTRGLSFSFVCSVFVLAASQSTHAQKSKAPTAGEFPVLVREIGEPVFKSLRIFSKDPEAGSRLLFGPTDDCTIGIGPTNGLSGLLLRDPRGVRILNPAAQGKLDVAQAQPTLLFGPDDLCRITAGNVGFGDDGKPLAGLILEDPGAVAIRSPFPGGRSTLVLGDDARCQISVAPEDNFGMIFTDPERFLFDNTLEVWGGLDLTDALNFGDTGECRIRAGVIGGGAQDVPLLGLIFEDPGAVAVQNPRGGQSTLVIGDPACQINVGKFADDGFGMIFEDPERFLFTNSMTIGGDLEVDGRITSNGVAINSSRRWKQNIRTMDDALDKITNLRGVYFDWTEDRGGQADLGFIAEEVAEVFPQATTFEKDGTTLKGLKYANLVAVAVEGIKAQQAQILTQHAQIEALQKQNASLQSSLVSLTSRMDELSAKLGKQSKIAVASPVEIKDAE